MFTLLSKLVPAQQIDATKTDGGSQAGPLSTLPAVSAQPQTPPTADNARVLVMTRLVECERRGAIPPGTRSQAIRTLFKECMVGVLDVLAMRVDGDWAVPDEELFSYLCDMGVVQVPVVV